MQTIGRIAVRTTYQNRYKRKCRGGSSHVSLDYPKPGPGFLHGLPGRSTTFLVTTILALLYTAALSATTIESVSFDEMLEKAKLVFEGEATEHEVKKEANGRIYTYVHFDVRDVIKGEYEDDTLTLRFTGGTADGLTMSVSAMDIPDVGETGIYFVESMTKQHTNPLLGWSQGHFLVIEDDSGVERVYTSKQRPVQGLQEGYRRSTSGISDGTAVGVVTDLDSGVDGMTRSQFVDALRQRLESAE